jgi:hypothetical protein
MRPEGTIEKLVNIPNNSFINENNILFYPSVYFNHPSGMAFHLLPFFSPAMNRWVIFIGPFGTVSF